MVADWCGLPIIEGDWREIERDRFAMLVGEIHSAALDRRGALIRDAAIDRLRELPLACYPGATLIEAQARVGGNQPGLSNHILGPWGLVTLDGGSAVIHDLNDVEGALCLDSEAAARAYHALFCNTVRGDDGRFLTLTDPNALLWRAAPEDAIFAAITIGVQVQPIAEGWKIEAPIAYGSALFVADFELTGNGMMEMVDDHPVAQAMPILAETWIGQFRLPPQRLAS